MSGLTYIGAGTLVGVVAAPLVMFLVFVGQAVGDVECMFVGAAIGAIACTVARPRIGERTTQLDGRRVLTAIIAPLVGAAVAVSEALVSHGPRSAVLPSALAGALIAELTCTVTAAAVSRRSGHWRYRGVLGWLIGLVVRLLLIGEYRKVIPATPPSSPADDRTAFRRAIVRRLGWLGTASLIAAVFVDALGDMSPFMENRRDDLADCFHGSIGLGMGLYARARVATLSAPVGAHASWRWGRETPVVGSGYDAWPKGSWFEKACGCGFAGITDRADGIGFAPGGVRSSLTDKCIMFVTWREDPDSGKYRRLADNAWLEAEVFLAFAGAELGLNPVELVDFVVGWFGPDLMEDDGRKASPKPPSPKPVPGIFSAIRDGASYPAVAEMLEAHPEWVDTRKQGGATDPTPLHEAAAVGRRDIVTLLLDRGAQVDARARHGRTALHDAAARGDRQLVELLLKRGANSGAMYKGATPLVCAELRRRDEIVQLLLGEAAKQGRSDCLNPSLRSAAEIGHGGLVETLLAAGAEADADGSAALRHAAAKGHLEIVRLLLANGAQADAEGSAALQHAAEKGHLEIMKLLLEHGAQASAERSAALYHAAAAGHVDAMRLLLKRGANANAQSKNGESAVCMAAGYRLYGVVELLLSAGAEVNVRPLVHAAAANNDPKMLRLLVEKGKDVDLDARDAEQCTALHRAAAGPRCYDVIRLLLDKGVDVNARDHEGRTALHIAVKKGDLDMAGMLLQKGAETTVKDDSDLTPLEFADHFKSRAFAKKLKGLWLEAQADLSDGKGQ